jgi:hypothetical protein
MAQLILSPVLRNDGRSVTTTNDHDRTVFGGFDVGFEKCGRTFGERGELKDAGRSTLKE